MTRYILAAESPAAVLALAWWLTGTGDGSWAGEED